MIPQILAPDAVRQERMAACANCENLKGFLILRCGLCGCVLKGKTLLLNEKCPAGKW